MSMTRIKKIQEIIGVVADGYLGKDTAKAILIYMDIVPVGNTLSDYAKQIQKNLGLTGKDVDGAIGPQTLTKIEDYLSTKLIPLSAGTSLIISNLALDKIIEFEISSPSTYTSKYRNPTWPGGESGVTIGIGYDLGYNTVSDFRNTWGNYISASDLNLLSKVVGLKGNAAKNKLSSVKQVDIPFETAKSIFYLYTLGRYAKYVRNIYPKAHQLPPDAQGALLSLVFNRGYSLTGDSRREMKNIQNFIDPQNLSKIANEIRSMKRLWPNVKGLIARRETEALLVEDADFRILRENQINV
jgi:hypothetical protein